MSYQNILRMYSKSSVKELKEGMSWYENANSFCLYLSNKYSISKEQAASVIAHLSPRNRWERNKIDAEALIAAEKDKRFLVKTATFSKNKYMAIEVLDDKRDSMPKGRKTGSFYQNILGHDHVVTVDSHAYCVAKGVREIGPVINKMNYLSIETSYIEAASLLSIKPYQLQACTWLTFKRIHNI